MKKSMVVLLTLTLTFFTFVASQEASAQEEVRSFQASLTPDIALHDSDTMIKGLIFNVWGNNPQKAFTFGIVNGSTGQSSGFSWAWLLNYADTYKGVHWAAINYTEENFNGWQSGLVNYTEQNFKGLQTGFFNFAHHVQGIQLGLINFTRTADNALQVGLLNILSENHWFQDFPHEVAPAFVFVNWRF